MNRVESEHFSMVEELAKRGEAILNQLTPNVVDLWHGATGVCTEAGELLDAAKKYAIYGKPLDKDNVIEELGDLEFYMAQVRANIGVSREAILRANIEKLRKRYPEGFTNQAAIDRADKK